ncbi:MAG: N-acetylmannosaminyltransferase [Firmicutes bacterium]|nr:N-acetylmannosaminyltransferase [Bacillota bacterium]MDI6705240.1 WecB/TagA/CpsF family glycosyltransferase [Bacillota bacterium]
MGNSGRVRILGIEVDKVDMAEALERLTGFLGGEVLRMVFTPNSEMIAAALNDMELKHALDNGDLVVPDGIGVVYASRIYGEPLPERVAGYDLMMEFLGVIEREKKGIFLLGGNPGIAQRAGGKILQRFPGIMVKGCQHGYFGDEDVPDILKKINESGADVLFVALGSPKQEKWIYSNRDKLSVKIAMGVGGSFDVIAGEVKRAPAVFRKAGLEWFYRLITQPWRAKRMAALPKFALKVIMDRKGGRRA